jgi:hypothetical protein
MREFASLHGDSFFESDYQSDYLLHISVNRPDGVTAFVVLEPSPGTGCFHMYVNCLFPHRVGGPDLGHLPTTSTDEEFYSRLREARDHAMECSDPDDPNASEEDIRISQLSNDPSPGIRAVAAAWLGRHRSPSVVSALVRALSDSNTNVRVAALGAIASLQMKGVISAEDANRVYKGALADASQIVRDIALAELNRPRD